jgi:hypothetical protein
MKFKIGDIVETLVHDGDYFEVGDIGTVINIIKVGEFEVNFNIKYSGSSDLAEDMPMAGYEMRLAEYTKSPLWRLMNE